MMTNNIQYNRKDTNFLRCLAILFIVNSHMEMYYPIKYLSTGGALGVSLFFALSSFGLLISERKKPRKFPDWFAQRIKRIYPPLWVALIFIILPFGIYTQNKNIFDINNILPFLGNFFFPPTALWFLRIILIYYIIDFFIIKHYQKKLIVAWIGGVAVVYAFIYLKYLDLSTWTVEDVISFKILFYSVISFFGIYLADINHKIKYRGFTDWILLFTCVGMIYGHKFMILKNVLPSLQFIQQWLLVPAIFFFFKISRSGFIQNKVMGKPVSSAIINYISSVGLEIYITYEYVSVIVQKFDLPFPLNMIIFFAITLPLSSLLKFVTKRMFGF